mgnify:CR=1 FL=1
MLKVKCTMHAKTEVTIFIYKGALGSHKRVKRAYCFGDLILHKAKVLSKFVSIGDSKSRECARPMMI